VESLYGVGELRGSTAAVGERDELTRLPVSVWQLEEELLGQDLADLSEAAAEDAQGCLPPLRAAIVHATRGAARGERVGP